MSDAEETQQDDQREVERPAKQQTVQRRPREEDDDTRYVDTSYTLKPLENATAEDWLGSNQDPDVLISVPNLGIDRIHLNVENVRAHVELHAKVLDLLELNVGADVSVDKVELEVDNVRVQAMVKVKLEKVHLIVAEIMALFREHPEILSNLTGGLGEGLRNKLSRADAEKALAEPKLPEPQQQAPAGEIGKESDGRSDEGERAPG